MKIIAVIFGLIIGSFLNVLILRLPKYQSILGRSKCPNCKKEIKWFDNIPVLSFIILKGVCRFCKKKISRQYPMIEILTAIIFLLLYLTQKENLFFLIFTLIFSSLLIVIGFIDLKNSIILDKTIVFGFLISIIYFLILNFKTKNPECDILSCSLLNSLLGILFFGGIFFAIYLSSNGRLLGFGDVKLATLLGFTFGFKNSIELFCSTFSFGFIIAMILLTLKKVDLKTKIPLGSIMAGTSIFFLATNFRILDIFKIHLYSLL